MFVSGVQYDSLVNRYIFQIIFPLLIIVKKTNKYFSQKIQNVERQLETGTKS